VKYELEDLDEIRHRTYRRKHEQIHGVVNQHLERNREGIQSVTKKKRKSPIHHRVKQHTRKRRPVRSYDRGKGNKLSHNPHTKKMRIKRNNPNSGKSFDFWNSKSHETKPFDFWGKEEKEKKEETKPFDFWTEEKAQEEVNKEILLEEAEKEKQEQVKSDIPYYSRDDLEDMFLGDTEEEARSIAKELGFEFEKETLKPDVGERILEFRYPIDTDMEPGIQEPDAYREIDLTLDLKTEKVTEVFSSMSNVPEKRWEKTSTEY